MIVRRVGIAAVAVALVVSLGACQRGGYGNYGTKETFGTLGGAALGGFVGSQFGSGEGRLAATAAGVVLGGLLGNYVGRGMDDADRYEAERAAHQAFEYQPDGSRSAWENPNTGHYGYTTPTSTYQASSGQYCRQYQTTVVIDGRAETATGTACRNDYTGQWEIVS